MYVRTYLYVCVCVCVCVCDSLSPSLSLTRQGVVLTYLLSLVIGSQ